MNLFQDIDRLSFWLGFLAGILFWLLLGRFWPLIVRLFVNLKIQSQSRRQERTLNDEIRLGNDTLRLLQHWHLADPLFSLDEIVIPPRLLAPEVPPMAYEPPPSEDITDWAQLTGRNWLPFMARQPWV
jgi:hypothetical protein